MLLILFHIGSGATARAESGIVAWKEQPHFSDDQALVTPFDRMKVASAITWFYMGTKQMGFEKHQFFSYVVFPPGLAVELAEPQQVADLKSHYKELDDFAKRFPKAAGILKPKLESFRSMLEKYESGKVLFTGKWMSRIEYKNLVAERDAVLRTNRELHENDRTEATERARTEALERKKTEARNFSLKCGYGAVAYLALFVLAFIRKSKGFVMILMVLPLLAAGWLTIQERGYNWYNDAKEKISLTLKHD